MVAEKAERYRIFRDRRGEAKARRLDEGEALGGRATAGRGRASGESSARAMLWGSTAASDAGLVASGGGGRWSGNGDGSVGIWPCHQTGGNQYWRYDERNGHISDKEGRTCVEVRKEATATSPFTLTTAQCDLTNPLQKWIFADFNQDQE